MNKTQKQYAVILCWDDAHFMELLGTTTSWEEALGYAFKRISQEEYEYFKEAIFSDWSEHPNNIPKGWQESYNNKEISLDQLINRYLNEDRIYTGIYAKSIKYKLDYYHNGEDGSYRFLHILKYKFENSRTIDIRILMKEINNEC